MTIARVSQLPVETVTDAPSTGTPIRVNQLAVEAITDSPSAGTPIRATQVGVEAVFTPSLIPVRVDQVVVEAIYKDPPPVRLSQLVAEAAFTPSAPVQLDHYVVEAIHRESAAAPTVNLVWSISPNWKDGITERLEFKSWDVRSHSGLGQRAALRWIPRLSVEFDILAHGSDAPLVDLLISAEQSTTVILPRWQYGEALNYTLPAGSLGIVVDTTDREFVAGGYAVIRLNSRSYELVKVLQVFPASITLDVPTASEWPASARLYPAAHARLSASQAVKRVTAGVLTGRMQFELTDVPAPASWTPVEALDGIPVMVRVPDGKNDREVTYTRQQNVIDYGFVEPYVTDAPGRAFIRRNDRHIMFKRAAVREVRGFFAGGQGRRRKFYRPVQELGLTLLADALATDTSLTIEAVGYSDFMGGLNGRLAIGIKDNAGTWVFAKVLTITAGAGVDIMQLTAPLGVNMPRSNLARFFFLELVTYDSDVLELHWHTDQVAETSIATIGVNQ